jgi:hypothetical protein
MIDPFDHDLSQLSPDDRLRVCRWIEDRFVNAITPLGMRMQREPRVVIDCDPTLQAAAKAVERVMDGVDEARVLAGIRPGTVDSVLTRGEIGNISGTNTKENRIRTADSYETPDR